MIVAVDIGTTMTKASAFTHNGTVVAQSSVPTTLWREGDGWVEQDVEEVMIAIARVIADVCGDAVDPPEALSFTGQGDGLWLRRADGSAPCRAISWMDARATPVVEQWQADGTLDDLYETTGSAIFPGSQAALLAWFAQNRPDILDEAAVAGYCIDTVIHRLCGVITVDASDASMPFLDMNKREYVIEALTICGVEEYRRLLAPITEPASTFPLNEAGATLLGLPVGLPVFAAPYDLVTSTIGAGASQEGEGSIVLGTTLGCQVWTTIGPSTRAGAVAAGMWLAVPEPGLFLRALPSMVGTASIDWILNLLRRDLSELEGLLNEPTQVRAVSITALPFLSPSGERAPFVNPLARGQFTGLTIGTTAAEIVLSLCESIAYVARQCLEDGGLKGDVYAVGGGFGSPKLAQIFADVLGVPLHLPAAGGSGERGAAIYGFDAIDQPVDLALWREGAETLVPDPQRTAYYQAGYQRYRSTLNAAEKTWRRAADVGNQI